MLLADLLCAETRAQEPVMKASRNPRAFGVLLFETNQLCRGSGTRRRPGAINFIFLLSAVPRGGSARPLEPRAKAVLWRLYTGSANGLKSIGRCPHEGQKETQLEGPWENHSLPQVPPNFAMNWIKFDYASCECVSEPRFLSM